MARTPPSTKGKVPKLPPFPRVCDTCGIEKSRAMYQSAKHLTCTICNIDKPPPAPAESPATVKDEPPAPPQAASTEEFKSIVAEGDYDSPTIKEIASRTLARRKLVHFIKRFRPQYMDGWVHRDICRRLERFMEAVERKESPRLLLMCPPRMGKSEISSRHFAPFILGHNPSWEIIAASHSASLALSFSRYIRDLMRDPSYQALFPHTKLDPQSQSVENWNTTYGGGYLAAGSGSGITGRGSHCFVAGTRVSVASGYVKIESLRVGDEVLGYDHETGGCRVVRVDARKVSQRQDVVEIQTVNGRKLVCTSDHPIYVVGTGYVEAQVLGVGSRVLVANVPELREAEDCGSEAVSSVLLCRKKSIGGPQLLVLRDWISKTTLRLQEVAKTRARGSLLLNTLFGISSRSEKLKNLPSVREAGKEHAVEQGCEVLLTRMRDRSTSEKKFGLPGLWYGFQAAQREVGVLFRALRERGTQLAHAWRWKLELSARRELQHPVLRDAGTRVDSGQSSVPSVREEKTAIACIPRRSKPSEQLAGESHNALHPLSWEAPQVAQDTVSLVRYVSSGNVDVYDLQVAETSNFFAEEILVHNCLILDDLVKDIEAADSALQRDNTWNWYISTAYTRLAPGGGVLAVMTTWHEDDYAGRIQQLMKSGEGDVFEIVKYPAINELGDEYLLPNDHIAQLPPGSTVPEGATMTRPMGMAVHPERYDTEALLRIKRNFYAAGQKRMWASLYQQEPTPDDGAYFTKSMFKYYRHKLAEHELHVYQSWDWAITEKAQSDYTVGVTIAQDKDDNLYLLDVYRFKLDDGQEIMARVVEYAKLWNPILIGFEDGSILKSLLSTFTKTCAEKNFYPSYEVLPTLTDKMVRAQPLRGRMQVGKFWVRENAPWKDEYLTEMLRFPAGKHDDQVDATAHCVRLTMSKNAPRIPEPVAPKSWKDKLKQYVGGSAGGSHMAA